MVMSMFENAVDELSYTLRAGERDEQQLVVARFDGREGLSQLFSWDIDVIVDGDEIQTLEDLQGQPAEFRILRHDEPVRIVRGLIAQVASQGTTSKGRQHQVTLTLMPKLLELDLMTNSRIFQGKSVQQIVMELVQTHNIELDWRLERRPAERIYCVQRNETDFEFFARILAEEGIHYFFAHDEEKTKIVFVDAPRGYVAIDGDANLPFSATGGAVTVDHVGHIDRKQMLRPGSVALRDYNFARPRLDLTARAEVREPHHSGNRPARETYLYPGDYDKVDPDGAGMTQRRLELARSDAFVFSGKSSCVRLQVGRTFTLSGHDDDLFNRSLLLTEMGLRGQRAGIAETGGAGGPAFVATFVAAPSDIRLRPTRKPKPTAAPESALVVGPEPGTPFVDEFGRVKVHFFWDRYDKQDENSSCWLRVMTPAAGGDRGIWFAPRVGDEVVVNFFNGDIDRPFVAGAMYNGENGHTYLPAQTVTKSTIRTRSIPGGKGHNELTFEDSSGGEEIYLHAQRDLRETVLASHSETIGATQTSTVGAMQTITVGALRTKTVGGDEHTNIGLNRTETVGQKETVTIGMGREHTISTGHDELTVMNGTRQIGVRNGHQITVVQYLTRFVTKDMEIACDEDYKLDAVRAISITENTGQGAVKMESGTIAASGPKGITVQNESQQINLKDKKISVIATEELVLQCGNASLSLKADGTVSINGTKMIGMTCQNSKLTLDTKASKIEGNTATISAKGVCNVSGAFVKIN
ncbi:type VI secretion system tip protein VgrG [Pendulispora brunnea]|uniref:Type VI secretion system tip protein VgrG n=1 Tax=Pendulispora brunnea TaxID=2905690 RepID=A0ABZ2KS22_9BACT